MSDEPGTFRLDEIDIFAGLDDAARHALTDEFEHRDVAGGEVLIRQGDKANTLYVVISGRFDVTRDDNPEILSEIGTGQTIGEIAFFAGGVRTATVTARRDSLVLCLDRAAFDRLAQRLPSVQSMVLATLARRLEQTSGRRIATPDPRPQTIVLVAAGARPIAPAFLEHFTERLARAVPVSLVEAETAGAAADPVAMTEALNKLERGDNCVVYIADAAPTPWSQKCIRQADLVVLVADADADPALNDVERVAMRGRPGRHVRLVLLHPPPGEARGTARWLEGRDCAMHHHVARGSDDDVDRLVRFVTGTARGLVAGGGGALSVAHIGVYRALLEAGYTFDMMGGTSGGAAMTAAFAAGVAPDEIVRMVRKCFVDSKAMRRLTVPRYGLIDHKHFDTELSALFGTRTIEDLWIPYFCVSTNLSQNRMEVHRKGCLWQAVRASGSIPALLPPFYTADGDMLVDGGLMDNVPVKVMREIKSGPNAVLSLEAPKLARFDVDYAALPSRSEMLRTMFNPFGARRLPAAPGILSVLVRALVTNRQDYVRYLTPDDLHLHPPIPAEIGVLDWHRHDELYRTAYQWCIAELAGRAKP